MKKFKIAAVTASLLVVSSVGVSASEVVSAPIQAELQSSVYGSDQAPSLFANPQAHTIVGTSNVDYIDLFNVTAIDPEDGDISDQVVVNDSQVNLNKAGSYAVQFMVTDSAGHTAMQIRTLQVINGDYSAPVIQANSQASVQIGSTNVDYLKLFEVSANDGVDGDITSKVTVDDSSVNLSRIGTYPVRFNVRDNAGNKAQQVTSTLSVVSSTGNDETAPVIMANSSASVSVGSSNVDYVKLFNIKAIDDVDGDVTSSVIIDDSNVNLSRPGTYRVNIIAIDGSGNISQKQVSLTVV